VNTAALSRIVQKLAPEKLEDDSADSVNRERQTTE
jgi:hypothetical protein